jgi:hypothetical protein
MGDAPDMPNVSEKTNVERLKTELRALEDLLRYTTGERRDRVIALIADVKRQIADHTLDTVVVVTPRRAS